MWRRRKPSLAADPRASEGKKGVDRICPSQHTLPAGHLTIECRMVEQKKTPIDPMPMGAIHEENWYE
jgi:hypothetical protein